MRFTSLFKSIISEYFFCSEYLLLFLKNTYLARGKLGEEGEVYLMLRGYKCPWYCQYITLKQIWLLSSVIITLPNQEMFCAVEKAASSAFTFSNWLIQWHFGAYTPILERATGDFSERETEARLHKIEHSSAVLLCAIYGLVRKIHV